MYGGIIVKECTGCHKIEEHFGRLWCSIYRFPGSWWRRGGCPFNTKTKAEFTGKVRVGQQKSKRNWGK